jgi:hypothetical protein
MIHSMTPLHRLSTTVLWFVALNALAGALSLILLPARTDDLFFWTITPPLNAALFGALYFGGAIAVGRVALGRRWEAGRILAPILISAGALISLVTFLHWGAFHPDFRLGYWLIIYIGAPLLAILIYTGQERAGANWAVTEPVVPVVRWAAVVIGALLVLAGLAILVWPEPAVALWPWPTGILMTRIFAAWFAAFGVGLLWFHIDRDWQRVRLLADLLILAALLDLAMLALHRADVPAASGNLWIYIAHLVGLGLLGLLMHVLQRRSVR